MNNVLMKTAVGFIADSGFSLSKAPVGAFVLWAYDAPCERLADKTKPTEVSLLSQLGW